MPETQAPFTPQDAQALLDLAQAAPLANMRAANEAQGILSRAVGHFEAFFNKPPVPPDTAPAPVADAELAK